jgi:hypothetical protein
MGEVTFSSDRAWGSALSRALMPALSLTSPHVSTGARTHFEIYCPPDYELRLLEPDFSPISRSGDFASSRSNRGDELFIDFSPPHPKATLEYSVRVCLDYHRTTPIDFALPVRRVEHDKR